ncbi:MAG TPA: hypothetical protein VFA34_11835 [Actinomycetota bacterium]|jgi:hypothetical protein|nr:hypothetical protein [Actinomycetota bacterium]
MRQPIDRRAFLALGVGAVAWSCSRKGGDRTNEPGAAAVSVAVTSLQLAVGDTRNAFAVLRGQNPYVPDELTARLVDPARKSRRIKVERQRIGFGPGGDEAGTEIEDIFTFRHDFDTPGVWGVDVRADGKRSQGAFQVLSRKQARSPLVGEEAIGSESPTVDDARGVDPICTRKPRCSMHELTIAQALDAGKPAVVTFGTPRFCTSRTCGPVVDIVEDQAKRVGDAASFVHVEVWRNDDDSVNKPGGEAPAFAEWKLGTEPWVYFIGADGVIADRWLGALGSKELRARVDSLIRS